jgi:hypothetical protein
MAKVIVERPRLNSGWHKLKGYQRRLRRHGEDGPPAREGIKACWQGATKILNELTALAARQHYGAEVYAVAHRRLARRELPQYPIPMRWW